MPTTEEQIYMDLTRLGLDPETAEQVCHAPVLIAAHRGNLRSQEHALQRPTHQRVYDDLPPLAPGLPGSSTYDEGGAEIMVCTPHKQEYCGHCTVDFGDWNQSVRRQAAREYKAAAEVAMNGATESSSLAGAAEANDALDSHIASHGKELGTKQPSDSYDGARSQNATNQESEAPSIPTSVATSAIPAHETIHSNVRFSERDTEKKQFQRAIKSSNLQSCLPGLPNKRGRSWLIVFEGMVFCTDDTMKVMITAWPMMKQGDPVLIKQLRPNERPELNKRCGTLLTYQDGQWQVDLRNHEKVETVWIDLKNLKPPAHT